MLDEILSAGKPAGETRIVNMRRAKYDIPIVRGTRWGNPFRIGTDGTREEVIEKYRTWIQTQPDLMNCLHELKGKTLGCVCCPLKCHGEVLVELVSQLTG